MASEYSQGVMSDGPVILRDGNPMTPEEIINELEVLRDRLAAAESERDRIKSLIANAPTVLTKYQIGDAIYDSPPMSRNLVKLDLIARPNLETKP